MSAATAIADAYADECRGIKYDFSSVCESKSGDHLLAEEVILSAARRAGMLVMLDGQIGRERYQSVTGSLSSFRRFAAELHGLLVEARRI